MKQEEVAYFAGLMDGEGTFSIQVNIRAGTSGRESVHFNPRISISLKWGNEILFKIKELFGGEVYDYMEREGLRRWSLGKREELISMTRQLLPYLKIKKVIAERFLEALEMFPKDRKCHRQGERTWTEELTNKVAYIALTLNPGTARKSKQTLDYLNELKEIYET